MDCGCVQIILQVCTRFRHCTILPSYYTIHTLFQYSEKDRSVVRLVRFYPLSPRTNPAFCCPILLALLFSTNDRISVGGIRFLRFGFAQNYDGYWIVVSSLQRYCDANNTVPNLNLRQLAILISLSSLLQQINIFLKS